MTGPAEMTPAGESPRRARALQFATEALHAAFRDDKDAATRAVQAISDEAGGPGMAVAVKAWCDTLIGAWRRDGGIPDGGADGVLVRPAWRDTDTGRVATDADEVPAEFRWAGRLIAARVALDKPAYDALIAALPADGEAIARHVGALLGTVALTLQALGWGRP